jgi:hypothetical protein
MQIVLVLDRFSFSPQSRYLPGQCSSPPRKIQLITMHEQGI